MKRIFLLLTLCTAHTCANMSAEESLIRKAISYSALTLSAASSVMNGKILKFEYKHGNPLIALPSYIGGQILPALCIRMQNGTETATRLAAGSLCALTGSALSWRDFKSVGSAAKNSAKIGFFGVGAYNYFQAFSTIQTKKTC